MAKFLSYYNFCPIHDTKEFLGLSKDKDEGNIITTLGRNMIIVIKLSSQKQIHSWTILDKLSSKVVYDWKSKQYVGVFGKKFMRCWDENAKDLNKVKKIKFQKNIVDLIDDETGETIILYSDGNHEYLSSAIENSKMKAHKSDEKLHFNSISNAKIFELSDGRKILTFFHETENKCIELVIKSLDIENQSPRIFPVVRKEKNITLAGYTVVEGNYFPSLLTIWSDKKIFTMPLDDNISTEDLPGNILSIMDALNATNPLSILGISKHCVAIYGANSGQEGGSLILYNTKFKVIKAKQFFKIFFNFSRLWVIDNQILLAMGQNLSVVSFRLSTELLSDLIGSQTSSNFQSYVIDDMINEEYELEEALQHYYRKDPPADEFESRPEHDEQKKVIANGKTKPYMPVTNFDIEFHDMCSTNFHIDISGSDSGSEIKVLSNYNDNGTFRSPEIEIIADELKRSGASEHEISEKLLKILMTSENDEDITNCLRRYTSISERMLSRVLKYSVKQLTGNVIENSNKIMENGEPEEEIHTNLDVINDELINVNLLINQPNKIDVKNRLDLTNLVLSCSFDTECLVRHIRNDIDTNEVLFLLEHLYNLITNKDNCLEKRSNFFEQNEDMKIFEWLSIFLTTHFQKLALSRDNQFIKLLMKWHEIIVKYKSNLADLDELLAILYNLIDKKQINKENKSSKWYSIEEIKLY